MWFIPNIFLIPSIVLSYTNEQIHIIALQQLQGDKILYLQHILIEIVGHSHAEPQQSHQIHYLFCSFHLLKEKHFCLLIFTLVKCLSQKLRG